MGIYEKESLIEKLSDGSDLSNATLVALRRCNKKIIEWIESLPDLVHCLLCGLHYTKDEILFMVEDSPNFTHNKKTGSVKADKYVFAICPLCKKELEEHPEHFEHWDSWPMLPWQEEFFKEGNWEFDSFEPRGEAKRRIVSIIRN